MDHFMINYFNYFQERAKIHPKEVTEGSIN